MSRTGWQAVRRLLHRRGRADAGALLIEGARAVDAVLARPERVLSVLAGPNATPRSRETLARAEAAGIVTRELTAEQTHLLASTAHPQDLFATVRWAPADRLRATPPPLLLHLSGLRDPSNVGALLRTAAAFGIDVTCSPDCADVTHPVAVRAGVASYFDIGLCIGVTLQEVSGWAPEHAVVYAAAHGGEPLPTFAWPERTILVVGGEAAGATETTESACRVTIPVGVESLNTAVAGGILLWAARSKKKRAGGNHA